MSDKDIKSKLMEDIDSDKVIILERLENISNYVTSNDIKPTVDQLLKSSMDYFPSINKDLIELIASKLHNDISNTLEDVPKDWMMSTPEYEAILRVSEQNTYKMIESILCASILARLTASIRKDLGAIKSVDKEIKTILDEGMGYQRIYIYGGSECGKENCKGCKGCKGIFLPTEID